MATETGFLPSCLVKCITFLSGFYLWNRISQWSLVYGTDFLKWLFVYGTEFLSGFLSMEQNFSVAFCLWNIISQWLFAHGTEFLKLMVFVYGTQFLWQNPMVSQQKQCDFKVILMSYDQYNLTFLLLFYQI